MKPERRLVMRLNAVRSLFVLAALVIAAAAAAQRQPKSLVRHRRRRNAKRLGLSERHHRAAF
jgi:hypothetical protein